MSFSQRFCLFIFIAITITYVYTAFFNNNEKKSDEIDFSPTKTISKFEKEEPNNDKSTKNIKIFLLDKAGNIRAVNRTCKKTEAKSCFKHSIEELISAPTRWEKDKGFTSEIPVNTKILSIRESSNSIMIDLSSDFESGGGAESTYTRIQQIIKTANANTSLPTYLYINGKQANVIGGEGIMIKQPLNERSFDE